MARPCIHDRPMTPGERMAKSRAKECAHLSPQNRALLNSGVYKTVKRLARLCRKSERFMYHQLAFEKHELINWGDVKSRKFGKIGMEFLAEVCTYGDADIQREVHDMIAESRSFSASTLGAPMLARWSKRPNEAGAEAIKHHHGV